MAARNALSIQYIHRRTYSNLRSQSIIQPKYEGGQNRENGKGAESMNAHEPDDYDIWWWDETKT